MRVSRAQAAENRQTVIDVASHLFREHGFDGIGIKDVMESAGLTQGAFYKQFSSKEDLAAQASRRALESVARQWSTAAAENPEDPLAAVIAFYLSMDHREKAAEGCPIVALGADVARQSPDVKESFESGVRQHLELLGRWIGDAAGVEKSSDTAMAVLSTIVGAVTLARVVNDGDLAQAFLNAAAEQVRSAVATQRTGTRRSGRRVKRHVSAAEAGSRKRKSRSP